MRAHCDSRDRTSTRLCLLRGRARSAFSRYVIKPLSREFKQRVSDSGFIFYPSGASRL